LIQELRVVPDVDAPHGRLGLAWAAATVALLLLGPIPLAVWMAVQAGLAAVQAVRSHRPVDEPVLAVIGGAAAAFALACAFGWVGAAAGLAIAAAGGLVGARNGKLGIVGAVIPTAVGAAAGSLVLARTLGAIPALFLLALMCAHDIGNYLVGTGANAAWEGEAAGVAAMGPVTLLAATVAVPPFTELGPWVLGGLAVLVTPAGPYAGSALLGGRAGARLPALRRLDALLLLGPVWVVAAGILRN
jgi:hypothetical protein